MRAPNLNAGVLAPVSPTLRAPTPADYEALASWIPDAKACTRWAGSRVPFPFVPAALPTLLEFPGGQSYVLAERAGRPVGFGQRWVLTPGSVHLGRIIIAPSERGRGFGRLLCQLLIEQAVHTTGAGFVTLRVYRDNATARSLYASLGFTLVEAESNEELLFMRAGGNLLTWRTDLAGG
jgi:[ribosomal protein S18]-alanine N-acetyltransferase